KNKGVFNVAMYLFANNKGTLIKLGNTICAIFSGTNENKSPMTIKHISERKALDAIKNLQIPLGKAERSIHSRQAKLLYAQSNRKQANWMSVNELSVMTSLPQKEVVGLSLKEEVEFGLNIKKQDLAKDERLLLGHLVQSGNTLNIEVAINKAHLNKHTFITGVTGSGKTTTCQRILNSANVPFLVIEPAKTEYRVLTNNYDDLLIFTLGTETTAPMRMNPFEFFEGENISSRVDMIKANIEAAFDMEAAIPQIIESALYECYKSYGWDIATSTNDKFKDPFGDGVYAFPTLSDLINKVEQVTETQGFDERLKSDYIGSIKARLQGLMVGAKGFMLNTPRSIDFQDLVERNVILELEEIKNGAEKSLVMGFILINLNEAIKRKHQTYKQQGKAFKHITLIEEAHRLLSKSVPGDNPSKKLGVETFSDMLSEVRKYGESLMIVDQIPNKLTPEVLKNTNTKIVHRLFARDDKEAIGNTMSLEDEQKDFLSNLEVGRAIVSNQDFAKPLQVQIKELEDISTTTSAMVDEQAVRSIVLTYYAQHYRRGVIPGLEVVEETPSPEVVEEFLSGKYANLARLWEEVFRHHAPKELSDALLELANKHLVGEASDVITMFLYLRFYAAEDGEQQNIQKNILSSYEKMKVGDKGLSRDEITHLKIRRR
ncbi:MAG: ATP-binding protein, partial [Ghiorsea sp.]|nr:ATP-binding protein [Ghiorsea sp.]